VVGNVDITVTVQSFTPPTFLRITPNFHAWWFDFAAGLLIAGDAMLN
jgi:hypothetical protein